ncbi:MAG: Holliday junction resolvase RuvX [Planctomycetaceae bacterium]|jgi:putative Holliday junction resolvase|nr:Holliday junction resolvase RuvX [Planctomycetaceae bacterium]
MEQQGRVAGIDFGTVRIGIALSDPERILASPYETYVRQSLDRDAEYFRQFVEKEHVVRFVLGLPIHLNGGFSEKAKEAVQFGHWLKEITGIEIDYTDERYTSVEAEHFLRNAKLTRKKRKTYRDKIAAQIILSTYLEAGCCGITDFSGIDD